MLVWVRRIFRDRYETLWAKSEGAGWELSTSRKERKECMELGCTAENGRLLLTVETLTTSVTFHMNLRPVPVLSHMET